MKTFLGSCRAFFVQCARVQGTKRWRKWWGRAGRGPGDSTADSTLPLKKRLRRSREIPCDTSEVSSSLSSTVGAKKSKNRIVSVAKWRTCSRNRTPQQNTARLLLLDNATFNQNKEAHVEIRSDIRHQSHNSEASSSDRTFGKDNYHNRQAAGQPYGFHKLLLLHFSQCPDENLKRQR